jgi:tetratricopeptide repeat protein
VKKIEPDAIAEAEVYIAYGRAAEARAILEDALRRNPARDDIRRKLAELALPPAAPVPQSDREVLRKIVLPLVAPSLLLVPGFFLMGGVFAPDWPFRLAGIAVFALGIVWAHRVMLRLQREGLIRRPPGGG